MPGPLDAFAAFRNWIEGQTRGAEPPAPPQMKLTPRSAYHCRHCDVAARSDEARPRCWNCGRFIKPTEYGISLTNAGRGCVSADFTS